MDMMPNFMDQGLRIKVPGIIDHFDGKTPAKYEEKYLFFSESWTGTEVREFMKLKFEKW